MGIINKNNYEAFFLDYHERNLSPQQVADLLLFVEQHPELKEEFENFENIKLEESDEKFIHKSSLKHNSNISDNLLIASLEGLLSKEEFVLLKQQLAVDKDLQKSYLLFQKIKLSADTSIVFENKEDLKKKERRIIPFYYYVAAAAAILLLFGLFYKVNENPNEKTLAKKEVQSSKFKVQSFDNNKNVAPEKEKQESKIKNQDKKFTDFATTSAKKNVVKQNIPKEIHFVTPEIKDEEPLPIVENKIETKKEITPENQIAPNNIQLLEIKNVQPVIANVENNSEKVNDKEFLSIGQLVATKIKENTLDANTVAMQKKNGRLKKLNGWDVLQMAARGISKLTGKKVEVKPTYNEEGDVTAYALGAGGFEFSKGK